MEVRRLIVGELHENCYIATKNGKTLIVDPGDEVEKIIAACENLDVVEVLITHHHFDHIGALKSIEEKYGIKENEKSGYFDYEVIKTPGHTSDCVTYYFKDDKIMFTGDFLFAGTIGRTDLETSNDDDMKESLNKIKEYPIDTIIYPGHGYSTILGNEKLRFDSYY